MMFVLTILLILVPILLIFYGKWKQQYWTRKGVPQLQPNLIFGNFKPILTGAQSIQDYYLNLYRAAQQKSTKHVGIYNLWMPEYMPIDLGLIKQILLKDFEHFTGHGMYHSKIDPLSEHLFTLDGAEWKQRRTQMTPTFTSGKMKMMFDSVLEKSVELKKAITREVDSTGELSIKDMMARFGTDIIASIAFGLECNTLQNSDHLFREIGRISFEPSFKKFLFETILSTKLLGMMGYNSQPQIVRDYFIKVVRDAIKYREVNPVPRKDYLNLLLQMKKQDNAHNGKGVFTDEEIVNESFLFYLAGFETSSSAMTFSLFELSRRQDLQEKLRREINNTVNANGGEFTYDSIMEMEYLDKIVKETLRKYPVLSALPRECTKPYKVFGTDVVLVKGTRVHIPAIGIHHDPQYYPNPEEYDPEHFSTENNANRPDFTYMPFGEGPRQCIGMRFGLMQTKMGIATVIKNFRISLDEKTKLPLEFDSSSIVFTTKQNIVFKVENV